MKQRRTFEELLSVVAALRAPDGCPWDRQQTHESLIPYMKEELEETIEGIGIYTRTQDADNLCEELGDMLFHILMHSQIASEEGVFDIHDVIDGVCEKMIRRHPHVFGEKRTVTDSEALASWEELKKAEKEAKKP
jgi:MazG family protein